MSLTRVSPEFRHEAPLDWIQSNFGRSSIFFSSTLQSRLLLSFFFLCFFGTSYSSLILHSWVASGLFHVAASPHCKVIVFACKISDSRIKVDLSLHQVLASELISILVWILCSCCLLSRGRLHLIHEVSSLLSRKVLVVNWWICINFSAKEINRDVG